MFGVVRRQLLCGGGGHVGQGTQNKGEHTEMNKLFDDDEPFLWLQADESEATASCGCTLMDDAQGARFHRCAVHGAAPDLLASLGELSDWMRSHTGPSDGTHEMLCRAVVALQKAGV
jgi:hypothetical protein